MTDSVKNTILILRELHRYSEVIVLAEALSGVNGEILRWAREFYNMNAEDAAKAIGVDVERYCNWEAGTDHPTYAKLRKISEVFRKPSAVFFFDNERRVLWGSNQREKAPKERCVKRGELLFDKAILFGAAIYR